MAKKNTIKRKPPVKPNDLTPSGYVSLLADLKNRIRAARVKAALAVNRELISLYWEIGKAIVERQESEGWGQRVIDRLAEDLQADFPGESGFSRTNVYRMRQFFLAYRSDSGKIVPQAVGQSRRQMIPPSVGQSAPEKKRSQAAVKPQEPDGESISRYLPAPVMEIPWSHNVILIEKLKNPLDRLWYAEQTVANGWSRAVLLHQIDTKLHERQGKAITNFARTLPAPQSDLAQQALKDPYCVGFLSLAADAQERDLERNLLVHIRDFLLELGVGFAFVGSQVPIEVDGREFFLDLLFYHLRLRCYFVIDLKIEEFQPEHAGKMDFYLSAVDDRFQHPDDQPAIGLILCRSRSQTMVEYTLRRSASPLGVATYQTTAGVLPPALRDNLPSVKQLAEELRKADVEDK